MMPIFLLAANVYAIRRSPFAVRPFDAFIILQIEIPNRKQKRNCICKLLENDEFL